MDKKAEHKAYFVIAIVAIIGLAAILTGVQNASNQLTGYAVAGDDDDGGDNDDNGNDDDDAGNGNGNGMLEAPFLYIENIFPAPEQPGFVPTAPFQPIQPPQTSDLFDWNGESPIFLQLIFELGNRDRSKVEAIEVFVNDFPINEFKVSKVKKEDSTGKFKNIPTLFAEKVSPDFRFKTEFVVPFDLPTNELKTHLEIKVRVFFKNEPPIEAKKFVTLLNNELLGTGAVVVECFDTDFGNNPDTPGQVRVTINGQTTGEFPDICLFSSIGESEDRADLLEYFCDENGVNKAKHTCILQLAEGGSFRACKSSFQSNSCADCEDIGFTTCPNGCANTQSDPTNCGSCGNQCASGQMENAGVFCLINSVLITEVF